MFRRRARITAAALVATTLASASAFAEESELRWYGSLTALFDMPSDARARLDHRHVTLDGDVLLSDELAFALAIGVKTRFGLDGELELASRSTDIDGASGVSSDGIPLSAPVALSGDLKTWTLMVNFRKAFGEGSFRPFVGAGVGIARHDGEATLSVVSPLGSIEGTDSGDDTVLAFQAMAGIEGDVSENMTVFAGLRYLASQDLEIERLTASYATKSIDVGVRLRF